MNAPESPFDWLVYVVGAGGAVALVREFRDWRQKRQERKDAAPESRAKAESMNVATSEKVVELVEERMKAMAAEIVELRTEAQGCTREVKRLTVRDEARTKEVDRLKAQIDVLERELRRHHPDKQE